MIEPVSQEHRREHGKAIRRREQWRKQYHLLSQAIRETKNRINRANGHNSFDGVAEVQLRSLRMAANLMMFDRDDIKHDLRRTAYTYVDRDQLAA